MPYLKQHRNASLELDGRRLKGSFDVSLANAADRETLTQFMAECRKKLRDFDPAKVKRKPVAKKAAPAKKKKAPAKAKRKSA